MADALCETWFTLLARWPDEVRLFTIEWEMIQTPDEALAALKQNPRTVRVYRSDPDTPRRDVSEDLARSWLDELHAHGFDPDEDTIPPFITEHLRPDEIASPLRPTPAPKSGGYAASFRQTAAPAPRHDPPRRNS